jgi:predicted RNA-binding Zn-ribbon protein involved in translation (DUF1610 family)
MEKYKEGDVLQIENQPAKVCKTCMSKILPDEEYVPVLCNCCDTLAYHHDKCLKEKMTKDEGKTSPVKVTKVDMTTPAGVTAAAKVMGVDLGNL